MKLTRRSLFVLLPGGLVAKWWKSELKLPSRHYDMIICDDVVTNTMTMKDFEHAKKVLECNCWADQYMGYPRMNHICGVK